MNYLASGIPENFLEPMILPVLLTFFGAVMFLIFKINENKSGTVNHFKWLSFIPVVLAIILGWEPFTFIRDPVNYEMVHFKGSKVVYAHYIAFFLPLLAAIVMAGWSFIENFFVDEEVIYVDEAGRPIDDESTSKP